MKKIPKSNCGEFVKPGDPGHPSIPKNLCALRGCETLPSPPYPEGSRALFCPDSTEIVEDGALAVAQLPNECLVRRCFYYGDLIVLTSMNVMDRPRIANRADCRLWPVIGVWFAGHSVRPVED